MLTKFENRMVEINNEMVMAGTLIIDANKVILDGLSSANYAQYSNARESLGEFKKTISDLDNKIITTLALFAPEARDLRKIIVYLKVTNEYNRAASNTKSFLKNFPVKQDGELHLETIMPNVILLQQSTIESLKFAVAIIGNDNKSTEKDLCAKANIEESKTDDLYSMVEKDLFVEMLNAGELSQEYFEALSLIRKIEKIGDRAADIANLLFDGNALD